MKTASYKPTLREVDATDVDTASTSADGGVSVARESATATNNIIVGRNRRVNDNNLVGQTVYTIYSHPTVVSYKELSGTHT